jgi:ABC-type dipeptide/oligopeptide/nickel transport system permease subunit
MAEEQAGSFAQLRDPQTYAIIGARSCMPGAGVNAAGLSFLGLKATMSAMSAGAMLPPLKTSNVHEEGRFTT